MGDPRCMEYRIGRTVKVTELPPGRWTQDYKEHLDTLIEKKIISGFTNNSTTENVDFLIQDYNGKDAVKDLKLQKTLRITSNMHLCSIQQRVFINTKVQN